MPVTPYVRRMGLAACGIDKLVRAAISGCGLDQSDISAPID